jgi:hypothetical protein
MWSRASPATVTSWYIDPYFKPPFRAAFFCSEPHRLMHHARGMIGSEQAIVQRLGSAGWLCHGNLRQSFVIGGETVMH